MKTTKNFNFNRTFFSATLLVAVLFLACVDNSKSSTETVLDTLESEKLASEKNETAFVEVMQKHLDAVSNRDLKSLAETMSPDGKMQLILPKTEIINGVDGFMDYHKEWFADSTWTFETKILNSEIGKEVGMAITEIVYREPQRQPEPYFNRMIVSYDLKNIDGKWYIIKDHASSIEKSTDAK